MGEPKLLWWIQRDEEDTEETPEVKEVLRPKVLPDTSHTTRVKT